MDGSFVPNISIGLPVVKAIRPITTKPLDVHLMIVNPDNYIQAFRDAGADIITVHAEACTHLDRTIQAIRQTGAKAGVALNPHTPEHVLEYVLPMLDLVLVMTVNPGFGGQCLSERVFPKWNVFAIVSTNLVFSTLIEVDGGVKSRMLIDLQVQVHTYWSVALECSSLRTASRPSRSYKFLVWLEHDFIELLRDHSIPDTPWDAHRQRSILSVVSIL